MSLPNYSPSHAFNVDLAIKYGVEEAILITHFQFWIRLNKRLGRNFIEERTWTYQTRDEIAAHFPYFTYKQVRRITDRLVKLGVLMKGNFNKAAMDKTIWYAFVNEEMFTIAQMGNSTAQMGNPLDQMGRAIPDTITPDTLSSDEERRTSLKVPKGTEEKNLLEKISEETKALAKKMIQMLLDKKPDFLFKATQETTFIKTVDLLVRVDKRSPESIVKVLEASLNDSFWMDKFFRPNPAKYLREKFDQLEMKFSKKPESASNSKEDLIRANTKYFYELKAKYPKEFGHCYVKGGYVINKENHKEAKIDMELGAFESVLMHVAGVKKRV